MDWNEYYSGLTEQKLVSFPESITSLILYNKSINFERY